MLIEVDNWTKDVLHNTTDYIIKPKIRTIENKKYVLVDDLVQAIADLTDELDRQVEIIHKFENGVQVYFKGSEILKLSPKEIEEFEEAEDILDENYYLNEDGTIEKKQYTYIIEGLTDRIRKLEDELEDKKDYIKEIHESKGW